MNDLDEKMSMYKNKARGVPNSSIYSKCNELQLGNTIKTNGFAQIKIQPADNNLVQFFFLQGEQDMNGLKTINVLEMMKEYNIEQKKVLTCPLYSYKLVCFYC